MITTLNPLKVNLEKQLLKQNKKLLTPKELLFVEEYDKYTNIAETELNVLNRIGLSSSIKEGKNIKQVRDKKLQDTNKFNQNRVFHISQIKGICQKYFLRFLTIQKYKGTIDNQLPTKVTNFEIAYNLTCDTNNLMIIAPAESFKLAKKPIDPLLFYEINDEYFYLIHKWGNDLNITRRFKTYLSNMYISAFIFLLIPIPLLMYSLIPYIATTCAAIIILLIYNGVNYTEDDDDRIRFHKTNKNWNKNYL